VKEISADEVKEGLNILRKLGVVEITFSGGNPLLREDIKEIIDYASRYFITTVYDNGSMAAEKIEALHNADFVAISLDSLNQEKNDYVKGIRGSWKKAFEAISKLREEGIYVEVSPTISQFNLHEIVDITKYFIQHRVPVCYCLYWYDNPGENQLFGIGKKNSEFEIADKTAMAKACDTLIDMKNHPGILITKETLLTLKQFFLNGKRTWKCKALQSFLTVDHLGRVAGCHLQPPAASIFELPDVWDSPRFEKLRQEYSECKKCAYLCYIFYSIHGSVQGIIEVIQDQWKNALPLIWS
jgi:MoaA/NifB/PqqE/SkfB family radical SAM enzyme